MKKFALLAMAGALLVVSNVGARAEEAPSAATADADCNRVIKASTESDKKPSPKQLADELKLPVEKVNACLLLVRHSGSGAPPAAPH